VIGNLDKLKVRLDTPVSYSLPLGKESVPLNPLIGKPISLRYTGNINCTYCGRLTSKSFNQGYCYPCFLKLAPCDSCIIAPEKCHFDAGTCREPYWAQDYCMQDHIVYFANSSGLKVGITRASQVPTRWIDQGAVQALAVMRVRTRQQSGFVEAMFRQHISDKTNWQAMLKGQVDEIDLIAEKDRLLEECRTEIDELQQRFGFHAVSTLTGMEPVNIQYPLDNHPDKVSSLSFDKEPEVKGILTGIKGQYLVLDTGVINIRRFTGYEVEFTA
jgi:hypothetical protein